MVDIIGWIGNIAFVIGTIYLSNRKIKGWYFNAIGNFCYILQGILVGTASLWILSLWLFIMNFYGMHKWRQQDIAPVVDPTPRAYKVEEAEL